MEENKLIIYRESYKKRSCSECICDNCNSVFMKPNSEINRNLKKGRKNFCSISCSTSYRNKVNPPKRNTDNLLRGSSKDEFSKFRETLRRAKMHSKAKNREFTITLQDLKEVWENQKGKCVYTGIELELPEYDITPHLTKMASLDRIDSSKGYTKDNIQFISSCINLMKNNLSDSEIKKFLKEISYYTSTFVEDQTISSPLQVSDALAGN